MTINWLFGGYGSGSRVATSAMASSSLIRCLLPSSPAFVLNELTSSRNRSTLFGSPVTYCCHTDFSASSRERASLRTGCSQSMSSSIFWPAASGDGIRLSRW